jgi:acyl-CoA reductase-like NAD-dependent aldehyde dehydrogenase
MTLADSAVETRETFDSLNPITGDVVASHPVHGEEEVRAAVSRAKEAAEWWSALSYDERETHLSAWKGVITRRIAQLADVMHQETGKPHADAMLEAALGIDHLAWAAGHAEKVLKRRRVP